MKKALFVLLILALAAAALGAGCGGSATSTPAGAAQLVLDLMQAGNLARASEHFVQRDTFLALIDAMRGKGKATAGSVQMRDPSSATVAVHFGGPAGSTGLTFNMVKSRGEWKIIQFVQ